MPLLLLRFLPYIIGFIAVSGAIYGAKEYVSNRWETNAGIAKGEANIQPKLDACAAEVEKQNAAVAALAEESKRRQAASAAALRKAAESAKVWEGNAAKLQAALTNRKPDGPQDCKAAWSEIRK